MERVDTPEFPKPPAIDYIDRADLLKHQYQEIYAEILEPYQQARQSWFSARSIHGEGSRVEQDRLAKLDATLESLFIGVVADHQGYYQRDIHRFLHEALEVPDEEIKRSLNLALYSNKILLTANRRVRLARQNGVGTPVNSSQISQTID